MLDQRHASARHQLRPAPNSAPRTAAGQRRDSGRPEVVENMRTWPRSGFSVDQSVYLPAGDRAGIERLVGYMTRCPFSLSWLVKVTPTGQVIYKAEKDACRASRSTGRRTGT